MKTHVILLLAFFAFTIPALAQPVGVGTNTPDGSAALDVSSTTKGMLIPRMTSDQRGQIASPATGLLVFDATTESFWFKSATNWIELVDTSNNLLKKNGTNIYTTGNTQLGIGTSTPAYDIHIRQPNANIGLTDATTNKLSGTLTASDGDLVINAYRSGGTGGNLILQRSSAVPELHAGNVGIGVPFTTAPLEKLQVNGNLRLQDEDAKIVMHNGTAVKANIYLNGNDVNVGTAPGNTTGRLVLSTNGVTQLAVSNVGELNRPLVTGTANMLPLAYGRISAGGAVVNGTSNFTVQKGVTGLYKITLSNESNVYSNRNNYVIMVTPYNVLALGTTPLFVDAGISADNTIEVRVNKPRIYYTNDSCGESCGPFSYINNAKFFDEADNEFSIVIYKQ
jgi:hypothetical protein